MATRFLLRDKASRFGTYVNGEPVSERRLSHGDAIRLGHRDGVEMVFLSDEEESGLAPIVVRGQRLRARWRRFSTACARWGRAACSTRC